MEIIIIIAIIIGIIVGFFLGKLMAAKTASEEKTQLVAKAQVLAAEMEQVKSLTDQVRQIAQVTTAVANGDLTQRIDKEYPGLFGETRQGINSTVGNLSELVEQIKQAVEAINTAASEISATEKNALAAMSRPMMSRLWVRVMVMEKPGGAWRQTRRAL